MVPLMERPRINPFTSKPVETPQQRTAREEFTALTGNAPPAIDPTALAAKIIHIGKVCRGEMPPDPWAGPQQDPPRHLTETERAATVAKMLEIGKKLGLVK
jgi:hypothetical protein